MPYDSSKSRPAARLRETELDGCFFWIIVHRLAVWVEAFTAEASVPRAGDCVKRFFISFLFVGRVQGGSSVIHVCYSLKRSVYEVGGSRVVG